MGTPIEKGRPIFGPAVTEDRFLRYTSVSSMQTFDEEGSEGGCNRKWFGEKVLGWESPPSRGQAVGVEKHAEVEHYYLTGEDIRSPIARAGAHLLPKRGPDLFIEQAFGCHVEKEWITHLLKTESDERNIEDLNARLLYVEEQLRLPGGDVPLLVDGLDLVGFIDMRHQRGEYVTPDGELRPEDPEHGLVVENIDHKFLGDLKKYAKPAKTMVKTIQMIQYGCRASDIVPAARSIRSSHLNSQTQRTLTARKVTAIMPVSDVRALARRHEGIVQEMRHVARIGSSDDVRPNPAACDLFGGCKHRGKRCSPSRTIYHVLRVNEESTAMSGNGLFDLIAQAADAAPAAIPSVPAIPPIPDTGGLAAIIPPDAPEPGPLDAAAPLSPEAIAEIQDPAFRLKVEEHARLHAEARAKEAAEKAAKGEKTSGNCPGGKQWVTLDPSKVKKRGNKFTCSSCGKELPVKPSEDGTKAELPGHRIPQKEDKGLPTSLVDGGSGAVRLPADLQAHADALDAAATNRVRAALAALPAIPGDEALPEIPGADLPAIPAGLVTVGAGVVPGKSPLDGRPIVESAADERARIVAVVEEVLAPFRDEVRGSLEKIFAAVHAR